MKMAKALSGREHRGPGRPGSSQLGGTTKNHGYRFTPHWTGGDAEACWGHRGESDSSKVRQLVSCRQNNAISCLGSQQTVTVEPAQDHPTSQRWEEALGTHNAARGHRPLPSKFLKSLPWKAPKCSSSPARWGSPQLCQVGCPAVGRTGRWGPGHALSPHPSKLRDVERLTDLERGEKAGAHRWPGDGQTDRRSVTCGPGPIGPMPRGGFILCIDPPMLGCPA